MSVFRSKYVSDDELKHGAAAVVDNKRQLDPGHGLMGVLLLQASNLKDNLGEEKPPFCIYDTALPDLPSHSDVFQRVHAITDEIQLTRRRALFAVVQNGFVKLSDFRGGILLPWAAAGAP